ncbi:MAG TPA: MFS transporter [Trinickia sp.]
MDRRSIAARPLIPRTVWALGFVSLFMDLSSEFIHALLPVFLVSTMGMSVAALGVLEGAAEATTMIVKTFSGPISDWLGKRKGLLLAGYGLAALSKPLFPLATAPATVVVARIVDRIGKGIRGAPRDALVADVAPPDIRGACYGLRQSMDTIGAIGGPLFAIPLMLYFGDHVRTVLWFAVVPAFVCVALLWAGVREPDRPALERHFRAPLHWRAAREFAPRYWLVVAIGGTFSLARFSEAFLVLRAQQTGIDYAWIPAVMVVMNVAYALCAYPVGKLADTIDREGLLVAGLGLLLVSDLLLGASLSPLALFVGVAAWGLHMGFTQGVLSAMVADTAPSALRGTAFGLFNLVSGLAMLLSSAIAGWLWQRYGAPATFFTGAGLVAAPLALCASTRRRTPPAG